MSKKYHASILGFKNDIKELYIRSVYIKSFKIYRIFVKLNTILKYLPKNASITARYRLEYIIYSDMRSSKLNLERKHLSL